MIKLETRKLEQVLKYLEITGIWLTRKRAAELPMIQVKNWNFIKIFGCVFQDSTIRVKLTEMQNLTLIANKLLANPGNPIQFCSKIQFSGRSHRPFSGKPIQFLFEIEFSIHEVDRFLENSSKTEYFWGIMAQFMGQVGDF